MDFALPQLYIIISSLAKFIEVLYMEISRETGTSCDSTAMSLIFLLDKSFGKFYCRLDLYMPTSATRLKPVVAFVTGGAWIIGWVEVCTILNHFEPSAIFLIFLAKFDSVLFNGPAYQIIYSQVQRVGSPFRQTLGRKRHHSCMHWLQVLLDEFPTQSSIIIQAIVTENVNALFKETFLRGLLVTW